MIGCLDLSLKFFMSFLGIWMGKKEEIIFIGVFVYYLKYENRIYVMK